MFLVRRTDVTPNGALPTVLIGYGAFGVRMTPTFAANWFQWFEAGGMLAVPSVRGGGEYGPAWHAAGARDRKHASFDDFIAAAEWLIANRYTNPEKLAVYGSAAGGLLAGGAIVSRPELFRAAVLLNPLLDMLRYDRFLQAPRAGRRSSARPRIRRRSPGSAVIHRISESPPEPGIRRCSWRAARRPRPCTRCTPGKWPRDSRPPRQATRPSGRSWFGSGAKATPRQRVHGRPRNSLISTPSSCGSWVCGDWTAELTLPPWHSRG